MTLLAENGVGAGWRVLDEALAHRVVLDLVNEKYAEVQQIGDSLSVADPDSPWGAFILATLNYSRSIDYEDRLDFPALFACCDRVDSILNHSQPTDLQAQAAAHYLRGAVTGYRAMMELRWGSAFKAYKLGVASAGEMENALEVDSTWFDALVGLGSYYYYRSARAGVLRSVGLITDRRDDGIQMVKTGAEKGVFSKYAGDSALLWILIDAERLNEALALALKIDRANPGSKSFKWALGRIYREKEDWSKAIPVYESLLDRIRLLERNNHYNEIGCLHALADAHTHLDNWRQVRDYAKTAFALNPDDETRARKKDDLRRLEKMLKEADKRLSR